MWRESQTLCMEVQKGIDQNDQNKYESPWVKAGN